MKTKKDILIWWEERGRMACSTNNDLASFNSRIDREVIGVKEERFDKHSKVLILRNEKWKYPLKLYFSYNECYRIVGF